MEESFNKIIILPGNGCDDIKRSNWYSWLQKELQRSLSGREVRVICEAMPDPYEAKEEVWVPHILEEFKCDYKTVLIGHSSGAEAIMRLIEKKKVFGVFLVSACHTDLGLESERVSGYYNREWEWEKMASNSNFIVQIHSQDDPFIPIHEAYHIRDHLNKHTKVEFHEFKNKNHFMSRSDKDLLEIALKKLKSF